VTGQLPSEADASVRSTLRNAATAEETYLTDNGQYTKSVTELERNGLRPAAGVTVTVTSVRGRYVSYCLTGTSPSTQHTWTYDSANGGIQPADKPCR
jgi:type IV pilus assembly protein PilA